MRVKSILIGIATIVIGFSVHGELVRYWMFDDVSPGSTQQTAEDEVTGDSVLSRGTSSSSGFKDCEWVAGYGGSGSAFGFDGSSAISELGGGAAAKQSLSYAMLSPSFSVEAYINPGTLPADGESATLVFLGEADGGDINYALRLAGTASGTFLQLQFTDDSGTVHTQNGTTAITSGAWTHVSAGFDADNSNIVLNVGGASEVFAASAIPTVNQNSDDTIFMLGAERTSYSGGFVNYYDGAIDELMVYDEIPEPATLSLYSISSLGVLLYRYRTRMK